MEDVHRERVTAGSPLLVGLLTREGASPAVITPPGPLLPRALTFAASWASCSRERKSCWAHSKVIFSKTHSWTWATISRTSMFKEAALISRLGALEKFSFK